MRKIYRDIVGGFIFSSDTKLLLGKSHSGGVYSNKWIIPGGGIDEGETQLEALAREILEETGIDIADTKIERIEGELSGESEKTLRDSGERVLVEMTFYNYKVTLEMVASDVSLKTEDDFTEAAWVSVDELHGLDLSIPTATTLKRLGLLKIA